MKTKTVLLSCILFLLGILVLCSCKNQECVHEWGDWTITSQSTCVVQGSKRRQCQKCDEIQTEVLGIDAHQYDVDNIVWTWNSYESVVATLFCSIDSNHTRQISAAVTKLIEQPATCSAPGVNKYIASIKVDGVEYKNEKEETVDQKSHAIEEIPAVEATCSQTGLTEGKKCSVCQTVLVEQSEVPMVAHNEETVPAVAATCTQVGLTEGKKCSVCQTVLVEQSEVPMVAHNEESLPAVTATCTQNGLTEGKKCSICQEILIAQTVLPQTTCHYESVITEPSCAERGYTTYTCTMCKKSFIDTYVDKLEHNWGAWEESGSHTIRGCTNDCDCKMQQRIISINATYQGIRLLTGEELWKDDISVTATLSDGTLVSVNEFSVDKTVVTEPGANNVTIEFFTLSTTVSIPAIWNNLPETTSAFDFLYTIEEDSVSITGYIGSSTDVVIPAHINRVPVRYIHEAAFYGNENIKSVVIPDSIIEIRHEAFSDCKRLMSISFGQGLTTIGYHAFYNCISLTEVVIPANVISIEGDYGCGAFEGCTGLKKIIIGDDSSDVAVMTIGERAFADCSSLTEVFIGNQVQYIKGSAFSGCTKLKTVTIGTGVQYIGDGAFFNCESLSSIVIPDSVIRIGNEAFFNCLKLLNVSFGQGLTTIGYHAFYNCISLTEVVIPANVISIEGDYGCGAFEGCTGLKKIIIGDDSSDVAVMTIGERAFADCSSLTEVFIGNQVQYIKGSAFSGCTKLKTVTIGTGVQYIGDGAFFNCESLSSIVIPDSVIRIGNEAFFNCLKLLNVSFGQGLTTIGYHAFYNCISLTELVIPVNVISIEGDYGCGAFENCTALLKVFIGDNSTDVATTVIGERAFSNCTALKEVHIGSNVKEIAENAFEGCVSLKK